MRKIERRETAALFYKIIEKLSKSCQKPIDILIFMCYNIITVRGTPQERKRERTMTQIITCLKNEEIVKRFKIHKSIFEEGFRILVDTPRYEKKNESVVDADGKSDRMFPTRELAAEFVFGWIDKAMSIGMVDEYTNEYRK